MFTFIFVSTEETALLHKMVAQKHIGQVSLSESTAFDWWAFSLRDDIWWIVSCVLFEKPYFGRTILGAYTIQESFF